MPGAPQTFDTACAGVPGNKDACPAQIVRLIKRLADFSRLHSRDQFVHEGNQIYAIKTRCGLRAYGWFDAYQGHAAFVISHYILKNATGSIRPINRSREKQSNIHGEVMSPSKLHEWVNANPERSRVYAQESLIVDVAEGDLGCS